MKKYYFTPKDQNSTPDMVPTALYILAIVWSMAFLVTSLVLYMISNQSVQP